MTIIASLREVLTLFKEAASVSAPMLVYGNIRKEICFRNQDLKIKKMRVIKMMTSVNAPMLRFGNIHFYPKKLKSR